MMKITKGFVKKIDFSSFEQLKFIRNEDSVFRILRITNCASLNDVFDDDIFRNVLKKSSHCFILNIQLNNGCELTDIKKVINEIFLDSQKYFLIEISQGPQQISRLVFYQNEVVELADVKNERNEVFDSDYEFNNFYLECIGTKSVLDFDLNSSDYQKFAKLSSEKRNPLLMRILKLFSKELDEDFEKTILRTLVIDSDKRTFEAYLELPIVDPKTPFKPTELIRRTIDYKYEKDATLLCIAAEKNDCDMVKLFLRLGASVDVQDSIFQTASDYAIKGKQFETLKLLLENDARFPLGFRSFYNDFKQSDLGVKKEIARISDERDELHKAIETKNINEIKKFREENPNLKFAYKPIKDFPCSIAALSTAQWQTIKDRDYAFYVECLEQQFTVDSSEDILKDEHKKDINIKMLNKFEGQDFSHILFLEVKTRLAFGVTKNDYKGKMDDIKGIYEQLSKIKRINELLKILEFSKSLTIVIDPINESVNKMDLQAGEKTDGLTYQNLGRIYVATAKKKNNEIAGVIVHEFTHYALQIIFKNSCNPYGVHDTVKKENFDKIVKKIESLKDQNHKVIQEVFAKNKNWKQIYKPHQWPSELIARVPQLIALKETKMFKNKYRKLYEFYINNVLPIAKSLTSNAEEFKIRREVEQLNENLGHIEEIEKLDMWLCNNRIETLKIDSKNRTIVDCNTPRLALIAFYQVFLKPKLLNSAEAKQDKERFFVFASTEDFKSSQKKSAIIRVWILTTDITLIVKCEKKFENMDHCKFLSERSAPDTLIIIGDDKTILEDMIKKNIREGEIETEHSLIKLEYKWVDIEEECRANVLNNTIISFQGINIKMSYLIDDRFPSEKIPLKKLVNGEKISIEKSKVLIDEYDPDEFIERGFVGYEDYESFLDSTKEEKIVMISGDAGVGKSVILSHIALKLKENYKEFWVTRVNLHEHSEAFAKLTKLDVFKFLTENFIKAHEEADGEFAQQIFNQLYDYGKVILLLDAVDEISPFHSEACNILLKGLKDSGKVHLWITTRPHLKASLEDDLKVISFRFKSFSIEDQLSYMKKFWEKALKLKDYHFNEDKLEACAEIVLSKFAKFLDEYLLSSSRLVELPLQTKMIAEAFLGNVENHFKGIQNINDLSDENISLLSLFNKFVLQKISIVSEKKGTAVKNEKHNNEIMSKDIIHIHERLALMYLFDQKIRENDPQAYIYSDDQFDDKYFFMDRDQFQRYGLVCFDSNDKPYFFHQTFAEFFVANFISKTLSDLKYIQPPPKSTVAIEVLFRNVISFEHGRITLLRFVDDGFSNPLTVTEDNNIYDKVSTYLKEYVKDGSVEKFENFKFIDYCIFTESIFILNFILECVNRFDTETAKGIIMENKFGANVLMSASMKGVKCIVQLVWKIAEKVFKQPQELRDFFLKCDGYNAFQFAFLHFPENENALMKDYMNLDEFKDSLSNNQTFDDIFKRKTRKRSTLETLFDIANSLFGDDEEGREIKRNLILSEFNEQPFGGNISENYFLCSLEEKWNIMIKLAPDVVSTSWKFLTTKTFFKEILEISLRVSSNKIKKQFYEWALQKNLKDFKWLVEDTFVKKTWECSEENGFNSLLDFIRKHIDVENTIRTHPELAKSLIESFNFSEIFPFLGNNLLDSEFEALLLSQNNEEDDRIISAFMKKDTHLFIKMLKVITKKYIKSRLPEKVANSYDTKDFVKTFWKIFKLQDEFYFNSIVDSLVKVLPIHQLEHLIKSKNDDGKTLFQEAARMRSMFFLTKLWSFARKIFDGDALEEILLKSGVLR